MTTYDVISELCKKRNLAITALERELGFGRGSIGKLRTGNTTLERLQKIADYFGVSVNYLTTGKEPETQIVTDKSSLTKRDSKQIEAILSDTEALLKQDGLMFDGDPASPEAIESILSAMKIGMEMAKQKNKEKYTPKKYKKDWYLWILKRL